MLILCTSNMTFWQKDQGSALYGPHMIAIETRMSPFPQSVPLQVGPNTHSVLMPTCEGGGRVEWRVTPFSSLLKLVYLPKFHCRLTRSVRVVQVEKLVHKVKDIQPWLWEVL